MSVVYDAALEPEHWHQVLTQLASLFRAGFADKFARTHDRTSFNGIAHGLDKADYEGQFLGSWSERNIWAQQRPVKLAGEILTTREILPNEELIRSEMYTDYLNPRGLHEGMRLAIWSGEEGIEDISLLRPWSMGPYTDAERDLARRLMPHLRRSAELSRRLMRAEIDSLVNSAALEWIAPAVLLLDGNGRIVHANPAALAQIRAGDGLTANTAGLVAATASATRALQHAIQAAAGIHRTARSSAIYLPRPSGRSALALTMTPINRKWLWIMAQQPKVLVFVTDPAAEPEWQRAQLRQAFGLTDAEAALAEGLLLGEDLAAIAHRTNRSVNTLRTHLARLMAKTGVSRRSELIRRLLIVPAARSSYLSCAPQTKHC